MFLRKKRSTSVPPRPPAATIDLTSDPSALIAAAQVVLKQQQSDTRLSSAAAAAALRSHTSSPIPVGEIQTKRMVRRGSNSSYTSGTATTRPPFTSTLQRNPSSGSLTSRSFRAQSPSVTNGSRTASPAGIAHSVIPPVPALPSSISSSSNRRASSLQPPRTRVASPPPSLPPLQLQTALANGHTIPHRNARAASIDTATSPIAESPRSINFSRPMSPPLTVSSSNRNSAVATQQQNIPSSQIGVAMAHRNQRRSQSLTVASAASASALTAALNAAKAQAAPANATSPPPTAGASRKPPSRPSSSMSNRSTQSAGGGPAGMVWIPMDEAIRLGYVTGPPPTPAQLQQQPARPSSAQATSRPAPSSGRSMSLTVESTRPSMTPAARTGATQAAVRQQRPAPVVQRPSDEQIKVFQDRAAALLARPLSDGASVIEASNRAAKPPVVAAAATAASNRTPAVAISPSGTPIKAISPAGTTPKAKKALQSKAQLSPNAISTRTASVSPSRSAHFSDSPVLGGKKHDPPPRAVSPFKSALKSPSPRPGSPVGSHNVAVSDTSSIRSEDGSVSGAAKRKKQVRVSFDATPLVVAEAAPPLSPINNVLSPQHNKSAAWAAEEEEVHSAPRAALPSFSSVRSRKSKGDADEDDESSEAGTPTKANMPLAPAIAVQPATPALEDTVSFSPSTPPRQESKTSHQRSPSLEEILSAENVNNVQDSSPSSSPTTAKRMTIPGPSSTAAASSALNAAISATGEAPVPQAISDKTAAADAQTVPAMAALLKVADGEGSDESDENADTYADASEDPSEIDEGGYASLDAIIENPHDESHIEQAPPALPVVDEAPLSNLSEAEAASPVAAATAATPKQAIPKAEKKGVSEEDWETVRKYWSSLSTSQRQQLEAEALPLPEEDSDVDTSGIKALAKAKAAGVDEPLPPWPDKSWQKTSTTKPAAVAPKAAATPATTKIQPPQEYTFGKKTLRGNQQATPDLPRKSSKRQNSKSPARSTSSQPAATRPVSGVSPDAIALAKAIEAKLRPTLVRSNSSDSDSSFKRKRRSSVTSDASDQRYSMKRSMRGSAKPAAKSAPAAPTSPITAERKRYSMRSTVRGSMDTTGSAESKESSSGFLGLGRSKQKKAKPSGGFSSKYDDSSDDDEPVQASGSRLAPQGFRSRFADSDGESDDEPTKLTPVRKIPRKAGQEEGDSTDLSDEEDSRPPTTNGVAAGKALGAGTLRKDGAPGHSRNASKSSFFSLRKKDRDTASVNGPASPSSIKVASINGAQQSSPGRPESRMSKLSNRPGSRNSFLFFKRRSFSMPTSPGGESTMEQAQDYSFPVPPIPERFLSDNLSPPSPLANNVRPNTSDGVSDTSKRPKRPQLGGKRDSNVTAPESDTIRKNVSYSSRTGKPKKFQGLRRMLKLHD